MMYDDRSYRRMRRMRHSGLGGATTGIFLIGLALSFAFGGFNLIIFFIALALATLVGSLATLNPQRVYGGFIGFVWFIMLALFFATGTWIWFLVGAGISAILGTLARPIIATLLGSAFLSTPTYQPQQQPYQPPQPTYQPPASQQDYQSYDQGYQPPPAPENYQEGGKQYPYPPTSASQASEQPQAQYPEQMPPQQ
jgi:hypothetical protein